MPPLSLSLHSLELAMQRACAEARCWLGATSPNPAVGAVALAQDGTILGVEAHHKAGEPHAEAKLLQRLRLENRLNEVAALCVTLEPCNHHGRTPPCTEAIIASGIKHVVIGARDPNPQVKGGGIEKLRQAGIIVQAGICEDECRQLIAAFAYSVTAGKPFVTIKRAFDRQGSMIPPSGEKTFTSPTSLQLAHRLRKKADAILTGSGTILADTPLFTVRGIADHVGKRRWLGILDRRRRVPQDYIDAAATRSLDIVIYDDVSAALADLYNRGAQDILVEAGPALSQHLLDQDLWTMAVTIQQAEPDHIDVAFNPNAALLFAPDTFNWDYFLPAIL